MDNSHNVNALPPDCLQMVPFEEPSITPSDIMARRLKNRERQRRYRARKRQEADLKKACAINPPPSSSSSPHPQVKTQVNTAVDFSNGSVTRIHCRRDWKKDARRAHMLEEQVTPSPNPILTNGSQVQSLTFVVNAPSQILRGVKEPTNIDQNDANTSAKLMSKY